MKKLTLKYCVVAFIFISTLNCSRDMDSTTREVYREGINGYAHYFIDKKTNEVTMVVKDEYLKLGEYIIDINKDTLRIGDTLKAHFDILHKNYRITIHEPSFKIIEGSYRRPTPDVIRELDEFLFKTDSAGLFEFRGNVEYDTVVIPFVYKFIVLQKK